MALNAVATLPPGCSQLKCQNVLARKSTFAYCATQSISLYRMEETNVVIPTVDPQQQQQQQQQQQPGAAHTTVVAASFPVVGVYGRGVTANISCFDFNEEFAACLTLQSKNVSLWSVATGENITAKKVPPSLPQLFRREGMPDTMRVAGKAHLLFGTSTGKLISLNTKEGHEPRALPLVAPNAPPPSGGRGSYSSQPPPPAGTDAVTCIDVSAVRADLVAAGTADGVLNVLQLSPSEGLRVTAAAVPFPPPEKEGRSREGVLPAAALPVTVCAFDPIKSQYVAVGSEEGALALCDAAAGGQVVQRFEYDTKSKMGTKVSGLAWVPEENGSFFTVSADSTVVRKWQINSPTCVGVFSPVLESAADNEGGLHNGDGAEGDDGNGPNGGGIRSIACLDKDRVVLGLTSGAVKVFNVAARKTEFETTPGHTDATLDGCVSPADSALAATCGADGCIRVWNLKLLSLYYKIRVGPVMVNSLAWAPSGKTITAGLGSGEMVQYHCSTRKEAWRTPVFPDGVSRLACSPNGDYVVGTSRTGVAVVAVKDGKIQRRYDTRGPAYGVDFEPSKGKLFAVGCQDHRVYLFSLSSNSEGPVMCLSGHSDAVTHVTFNPTTPNFLLSASSDHTLRVWDLSSNDAHAISVSARVLKGHSDRVRAAAWCSLAPYLALSGSIDATVRVWDVRNGVTVIVAHAHTSEVTSVSSSPERPLVFLTTSRDSTLVMWQLGLLRQVYLDAALGKLDECIVGDPTSLMQVSSTSVSVSVVAGAAVARLSQALRDPNLQPADRMAKLIDFFDVPCGATDVLEMSRYLLDPNAYTTQAKNLVVPTPKLVEAHRARAKHAADKAQGKTVRSAGAEYKKRRLLEAADMLLQTGQIEAYCETLMLAGEWDRAIAVAPMISREFWRRVCLSAAAAMEASGDPRAVTYYIMAEESARAARLLAQQSPSLTDVATVVSEACPQRNEAAAGGGQQQLDMHGNPVAAAGVQEPNHLTTTDLAGTSAIARQLQQERVAALARFQNPRLTAAAFLAAGAPDEGVRVLLRSGDVMLAHLVVHTVPLRERASIDGAFRLSMLQSMRQHKWETAVECGARQSNAYDSLATLVALFQYTQSKHVGRLPSSAQSLTSASMASLQAVNDKLKTFYETVRQRCAQLQLTLDPQAIQQQHASDGLASQNQLAAMVISADPAAGPTTAPALLQSFTGYLTSLLEAALQDADSANAHFFIVQALAITSYVALPIATTTNSGSGGADASSPTGGQQQQQQLAREHKEFLSLVYLVAALHCVKVYRLPRLLNVAFTRAREMAAGSGSRGAEQLLARAQASLNSYGPRAVEVDVSGGGTAAALPMMGASDGRMVTSALTGDVIRGGLHLLEDGSSYISKSEGLAWTLCCHFSPLATGARIIVL